MRHLIWSNIKQSYISVLLDHLRISLFHHCGMLLTHSLACGYMFISFMSQCYVLPFASSVTYSSVPLKARVVRIREDAILLVLVFLFNASGSVRNCITSIWNNFHSFLSRLLFVRFCLFVVYISIIQIHNNMNLDVVSFEISFHNCFSWIFIPWHFTFSRPGISWKLFFCFHWCESMYSKGKKRNSRQRGNARKCT